MTDQETRPNSTDPDNPYNIDYARERRLKRMFQIMIGAGFAIAFLLLAVAYTLDTLFAGKSTDIAPVTPYSTPAQFNPKSKIQNPK